MLENSARSSLDGRNISGRIRICTAFWKIGFWKPVIDLRHNGYATDCMLLTGTSLIWPEAAAAATVFFVPCSELSLDVDV